jgi:hypothetical protein
MQMLEQQVLSRANLDILALYAQRENLTPGDRSARQLISTKIAEQEAQRDTIKSTKDPREILALSKGKTGETAGALRDYALAVAGIYSQLTSLNDQVAAIKFTSIIEAVNADLEQQKRLKDEQKSKNNLVLQELSLTEKINGSLSDAQLEERSSLVIKTARLDADKQSLDLTSKIAIIEYALSTKKLKDVEGANTELEILKESLKTNKAN